MESFPDMSGVYSCHQIDTCITSISIEDPQYDSMMPSSSLRKDDIKTEYHPHSDRQPEVQHFEDYNQGGATKQSLPHNTTPWQPFRSRIDFEFAEVALQAALNHHQVDILISLMHRCASGSEDFTFTSHRDLDKVWNHAHTTLTVVGLCNFVSHFHGSYL
jgi:hypothetical protein